MKHKYDDFEAVVMPSTLSYKPKAKTVGYMLKSDHIWHWTCLYEAVKMMDFVSLHTREDGSMWAHFNLTAQHAYIMRWAPGKGSFGNSVLYKKILHQMKEGDDFERLKYLAENTFIERREDCKPKGVDRFITKIEKPIIERETGNLNKNTFDFITVECHILKEEHCDGNRSEYIRIHRKEIDGKVLEVINNSRSFLKYGVPVNILKLNNLELVRDSLIYRFGVKGE